jgi:O-6-methylguanine DNA methyltransferase
VAWRLRSVVRGVADFPMGLIATKPTGSKSKSARHAKPGADTLYTARIETPIGELTLGSTIKGLAYVALPRANGSGLMGWQRRHAPDIVVQPGYEANKIAAVQLGEFLEGKRKVFDLPLDLRATDFQQQVYAEVAAIPYGEWLTYGDIAKRIGRPKAVRAVGAANGANPLPLVIPCHRVLGSKGDLHGYSGGLDLKAKLIAMERGAAPGQEQLF